MRRPKKSSRSTAVLAKVEIDIYVRRLRAKRVSHVRTQIINLDHNLVGGRVIRCQFPADAAGGAGAGAWVASVDGLGDGGVVAGAAVPCTGGQAGIVAGAVLSE